MSAPDALVVATTTSFGFGFEEGIMNGGGCVEG